MRRNSPNPRYGTHILECALVYPALFTLLLGMIVGGMGVFRYIETAHLAREAARYAAVHAGMYQQENAAAITAKTLPDVDEDYITNTIVVPNAVSMDTSQLSVSVTFNMGSGSYDWDDTTHNGQRYPYTLNSDTTPPHFETNTVSVTVSYNWTPEWLLAGPITLSSTSVHPINY